jgi:mannose-6-phosphate isomerase-like protein (cupin superfamily)
MYNGSPERYDWELLGKKEIYVPYNSYRLHSDELSYDELLQPLHLNPEVPRYELHRVWVVEATLKEGTRHQYKRRTFYIDEDSWQIVHVDQYDNRDELWRVSEGHGINYYDVPTYWTTLEVHYDLQEGRYLAVGLNNEAPYTYDFEVDLSPRDFTPGALRRAGRR